MKRDHIGQMVDRIRFKLKNARLIRMFCKPYMDHKRKILYKRYLGSEDSGKVKSLKDTHTGERCFIIGNGPSLLAEDLDRLKNEHTFASNRIYEIFDRTGWRPSFYMAIDPDFLSENYDRLQNYHLDQMFLEYAKVKDLPPSDNVIGIYQSTEFVADKWNDMTSYISEDVSDHFSNGYTITFNAIQLAIYMGFKEIYLLGVDFSYSVVRREDGKIHYDKNVKDYFSGKKYNSTIMYHAPMKHAYEVAKKYCDANGIKIVNVTRGGKLEVFDRMDLDLLLAGRDMEAIDKI